MLLLQIKPDLKINNALPAHQFGIREKHGTIEQANRITSEIRTAFQQREYCTAIFLDVAQAFDRAKTLNNKMRNGYTLVLHYAATFLGTPKFISVHSLTLRA